NKKSLFLMAKKKKKKKSSKSAKKKQQETSLDDALKTSKKKITESTTGASIKATGMPKTELSLDSALSSAKETQTDLQSLLKGVSEGEWYDRELDIEETIEPQLSHERKSDIVEGYLIEDVPIAERKTTKSSVPVSQKAITATPSKDNIYQKLQIFIEDFVKGYNERYNRWENSISNILAILRKMRKFTKKNTEDLIHSINNLFDKMKLNLGQFKTKRDDIEKISSVNLETMSGEFKKVLGMLELQVKEYQLKKITDELIREEKLFSL
ncbi:MAG: hypothetical protein ACFFAH_13870, partial [Promethearchaeota archaeon]